MSLRGCRPGRSLTLAFAVCLVSSHASAQVQWTQIGSLPLSGFSAAVFDSGRDRVVAYSGFQTWEYDGTVWAQVTSPLVPTMPGGVMAYDAGRQRCVLAGLGPETWEWDGQSWTQVSVNSPVWFPGGLVYHAGRGTVIQFGGEVGNNGPTTNDLWEWNGSFWQLIPQATAPPISQPGSDIYYDTLAYDAARDVLVVFGATVLTLPAHATPLAVTWEWDVASGWRQVNAGGPLTLGRYLVWNEATGRAVLRALFLTTAETWEWSGTGSWQRRSQTSQPVGGGPFVYDSRRQRCLLLSSNGTLWAYSPTGPARYDLHGAGCPGSLSVPELTLAAPWTGPWLGDTFATDVRNLPWSATILATGFQDQTFGTLPLPVDFTPLGMPGCLLRIGPDNLAFALGVANTVSFRIDIPSHASLRGLRFYQQAYSFDPRANAFGGTFSNSMVGVTGMR